jgi:uncharacterized DUF497 family protein
MMLSEYEFELDMRKSDENRERRGFDFAFASRLFRNVFVEKPDLRRDYGESRRIASGWVAGIPLTVVFTDRTDFSGQAVRRIISARISNRKERRDDG